MYRRFGLAAACVLALMACADRTSAPAAPAPESVVAELIDHAASDFRAHVAADGADFRAVYAGTMRGEDGASVDLICGEFRAAGQDQWAPFATIKTDPYENWIGGTANGICSAPTTSLTTGEDFSGALTARYSAGG